MKLKGEMVIELTDTNTDAVEKVQETNMITEAVNNILGLNPMGIYLSGKRLALLPAPPLRTVRDSFPSYGSSLS